MKKFPKQHYLKETIQKNGWGKKVFIFNKLKFYEEWYCNNKSLLLNINRITLKQILTQYVEIRNPDSLFKTKLMDIDTEIALPHGCHTNKIENKFEVFLKNREFNDKNYKNKLLEENTDLIGEYFALQISRTFQTISDLLVYFKEAVPFKLSRSYSLSFREYYNEEYKKIFSRHYLKYYENRKNILFINGDNINKESYYYLPEINTLCLFDYLRFVPMDMKKNVYPEKILKESYFTILKNNKIYFYITTPNKISTIYKLLQVIKNFDILAFYLDNPKETDYYRDLIEHINRTWNSFALQSCCEYIIIKNEEIDLETLCDFVNLMHKNDAFEAFYKESNENMLQIKELEKFL